jgi:hypothetical protein
MAVAQLFLFAKSIIVEDLSNYFCFFINLEIDILLENIPKSAQITLCRYSFYYFINLNLYFLNLRWEHECFSIMDRSVRKRNSHKFKCNYNPIFFLSY